MLLAQLEAFVHAARHGSVTRAAELLFVTQPALTARIQGLERSLGAGRRRVRLALLGYLADGTAADVAGAARAWYPTLIGVRYLPGTRTLTSESAAELDRYRDLDRRYLDTALRRFVTDDDLDLRRCLLPGLSLRHASYPAELHELGSGAASASSRAGRSRRIRPVFSAVRVALP